jgi:hypothetical protein
VGFHAFVFMMLALDLGVFNRRVHALDSLAIQRFGPLFFLSTFQPLQAIQVTSTPHGRFQIIHGPTELVGAGQFFLVRALAKQMIQPGLVLFTKGPQGHGHSPVQPSGGHQRTASCLFVSQDTLRRD